VSLRRPSPSEVLAVYLAGTVGCIIGIVLLGAFWPWSLPPVVAGAIYGGYLFAKWFRGLGSP
jgi:hypothetical protein